MTDSGDHKHYCPDCGSKLRVRDFRSHGRMEKNYDYACDDCEHALHPYHIERGGGESSSDVDKKDRVCPGCQHLNKNCTCDEPTDSSKQDSSKSVGEPPQNRIEQIIDREITGFEERIQLELENKEETEEDSFSHKRSIIRINCLDLARRKLEQIKTEVKHDV